MSDKQLSQVQAQLPAGAADSPDVPGPLKATYASSRSAPGLDTEYGIRCASRTTTHTLP